MSSRAPTGRATSRATILFNERYEYSARWDGDAQAKKDAAAAKRTATSLKTAVKSFEALLEPEQLASMVAAAVAMRELASDLDQVCRLANRRKAEYTAAEEAKRKGNADATAAESWGGDDGAMLAEAQSLASFVDAPGQLGVEAWVLGRLSDRPHLRYVNMPTDMPAGGRLLDMLARLKETRRAGPPEAVAAAVLAIRRRAAEYLKALQEVQSQARTYKDMYYAGADDYKAWREWTAAVRAAVIPPMASRPAGNK